MTQTKRTHPAPEHEAAAAAARSKIAFLGEPWTLLILRELWQGVDRYGPLQRKLEIPLNKFSVRMKRLIDHGLVERLPHQKGADTPEYRVTSRGAALYPALLPFLHWADEQHGDSANPLMAVRHSACGAIAEPLVVCAACGRPITAGSPEDPG